MKTLWKPLLYTILGCALATGLFGLGLSWAVNLALQQNRPTDLDVLFQGSPGSPQPQSP